VLYLYRTVLVILSSLAAAPATQEEIFSKIIRNYERFTSRGRIPLHVSPPPRTVVARKDFVEFSSGLLLLLLIFRSSVFLSNRRALPWQRRRRWWEVEGAIVVVLRRWSGLNTKNRFRTRTNRSQNCDPLGTGGT